MVSKVSSPILWKLHSSQGLALMELALLIGVVLFFLTFVIDAVRVILVQQAITSLSEEAANEIYRNCGTLQDPLAIEQCLYSGVDGGVLQKIQSLGESTLSDFQVALSLYRCEQCQPGVDNGCTNSNIYCKPGATASPATPMVVQSPGDCTDCIPSRVNFEEVFDPQGPLRELLNRRGEVSVAEITATYPARTRYFLGQTAYAITIY